MRIIFLLLITLVCASSCNQKAKEIIGIVTPGPNEYKVQRNKLLEVPPHYDLPSSSSNKTEESKINLQNNLNDGERALIKEMED